MGKLHCAVAVVDGCLASTIFGPLELLFLCQQLQLGMPELTPCEITFELLSPDGEPFTCLTGGRHAVDGKLRDLPEGTVILLPGFGFPLPQRIPGLLLAHAPLGAWLRRQYLAKCSIAAWCSGSFLLAEHGLLPGKRATTHWIYSELFRARYPAIKLDMDAAIVEDQRIHCLGGTACGLDTIMSIIERHVGKDVARLCTKTLGLETRPPSQLRYEERQASMRDDALVDKAVHWIRGNFHRKISLEDILRQVPASRRNFSRRFRMETGESVQGFIQRLRMDRARLLLETSAAPIEHILEQVGYQDPSAFARRFKQHTQLTPQQYRQQFGLS